MTTDDDRAAIDQLHHSDQTASVNRDFAALISLLSDDIVMMPPGAQPVRGLSKVQRQMEAAQSAGTPTRQVLSYSLNFEEVTVVGDYAFEWGTIRGESREPNGEVMTSQFNVMRILIKQRGTWKVHRTIWNEQK